MRVTGDLAVMVLALLVALGLAVSALYDAEQRANETWGWAVGVFLFAIIFLPRYLARRKLKGRISGRRIVVCLLQVFSVTFFIFGDLLHCGIIFIA